MRTRDRCITLAAVAAVALTSGIARAACESSYPVRHEGLAGAFDFTFSDYEDVAAACGAGPTPPMRYWSFGRWFVDLLEEGSAAVCRETWLNRALDLGWPGAHTGQWTSVQGNWFGPEALGCPASSGWPVFVETSFVDASREGTEDHRGLYAVALVADVCGVFAWDLDLVSDGLGPAGNVVPVVAIPPPEDLVMSPAPGLGWLVEFTVPDAPGFGTDGHPPAVAGYRVLYKIDPPPLSSDPAAYDGEILDPAWPGSPLGVIAPGTRASGYVPMSFGRVHLATQIAYEGDPLPFLSRATSAHRSQNTIDMSERHPTLGLTKSVSPAIASPGDTVTYTIAARNYGSAGRNLEIWDVMGQDLAAGCLDLATVRSLACAECDALTFDPATGKLRAHAPAIAAGGAVTVSFQVDVGPAPGASCRNVAWAAVEQHRYLSATAGFDGAGPRSALLRDDSIGAIDPRPDFASIFPLPVYLDPSPPFPFTDEPGLLGDPLRPLVLYGYADAVSRVYLVKSGDTVAVVR